jgi:uncharacterized protein YggE
MDRKVTFSVRGALVAGLVALAVVAAYLVGHSGGTPARAGEDSPAATRTVTVQGVGHVSVVPDQLGFDLSVDLVRDDLNTALDDSNAAMRQVVDTLEAAGVADKDVQTTDLSMNPEYSHKRGEPTTFRGYRVSQTVSVVVEDLASAGDIVTAAVTSGGTGVRLDGLRLQVGDPEGALKPARTDAFEQARAKAEEYAADTGRDLGEVVKVSELAEKPQSYDTDYREAASVADSSVPIQAGQQDLTASVVVVFELE